MGEGPHLAMLGSIVGDPSRASMLGALMGGMALTAQELAREAGVTPSTASSHLAMLVDRGMLAVLQQGRHRYYRIADSDIAELLEGMMAFRAPGRRPGPTDPALRRARTCYDHMAGELGVRVFASLIDHGHLVLRGDGIALSPSGETLLRDLGCVVSRDAKPACRSCLDWSERRSHLGGRAGAALLGLFLERGWVRRGPGRALAVTPGGTIAIDRHFPPGEAAAGEAQTSAVRAFFR
ncbi:MAG: transcriptional regulator protein [Bradyrhizobium sp.]|nr:transcriptional regulator protein [Bradyrhizobium sp.]